MSEITGIVLLNLGGPDTQEAVEPFLLNLFNDPDIINFPLSFLFRSSLAKLIATRRSPRIREEYMKIGGGSPLKKYTLLQAKLLEDKLNNHFPAKVYTAMRYWHPFTREALDEIEKDGVKKVYLLPLYPQYSMATTLSSLKEWKDQVSIKGLGRRLSWAMIESYHDFPPYIDALIERVDQGLEKFPAEVRDDVHILFSAHGTPMKLVKAGDPYSHQIKKTCELIIERGEYKQPSSLAYQSKVGPQKWLTPSTPTMIEQLAANGVKNILAVPVAFASDHLETLVEVGMQFRDLAMEKGIKQFEVTEGLNDSDKFISALEKLILNYTRSM